MKVCVLGGSGFIGSYVVKALAAQGHDIVCLLRARGELACNGVDPGIW